ncbi:uncharacterized protein LOC132255017 [Vitis vinifera]|uniref:Uncharacterized protein n=2 Tax=Vitis vinifera TaxID=29760 RepID=D7TSW2_VITVI
MASAPPAFSTVIRPSLKHNSHRRLRVRAQSFRDEGRQSNMVDASLSVLRERIEQVQIKERLERCCRREHGWNYAPGYNYKLKRDTQLSDLFGLVGLAAGTVGITLLSGTLGLCLVSLVFHLSQ